MRLAAIWYLCFLLAASGLIQVSADDRLADLKQQAAEYKLFLDSTDMMELVLAAPVLRYNDNVTGVVDAVQLLWLHDGCPEATASFWYRKDGLTAHEFQSLSKNRVVAKLGDRKVWHPRTPGVDPTRLADVPQPAKTAPGRLERPTQSRRVA